MRNIITGGLALLTAALCVFPVHGLSAQKAIVMDGTSGTVLYQKNAEERSLIASTTKIMTALLVCENCNVLDTVEIPAAAVGIEGSSMYLREGETLTVQELLYGLMLSSGNDAAVALAIFCDGSTQQFAARMNAKANTLGMTQTHFENPNGLDGKNHYSTARDLGILASYAMENHIFAKTVSTKTVTLGERYLRNHNKLLWQYPGADGVKTGYTKAAGRILVSSATRNGRRLVCVTIDAPDDWNDHKALLNEGFSRYKLKTVVKKGQLLDRIAVEGGEGTAVSVIAAEDVSLWLLPGEHPGIVRTGKTFSYAPAVQGTDAGNRYVVLNGKALAKISAVYGQTVEQSDPPPSLWKRLLH